MSFSDVPAGRGQAPFLSSSVPHGPSFEDAVLEAAIQIAGMEGEAAVTPASISRRLAVPEEDISRLFSTNEAILHEVEPYLKRRLANFLTTAFQSESHLNTDEDRILALGDAYFAYTQEEPRMYHYLFERHGVLTSQELVAALTGQGSGNASFDVLVQAMVAIAQKNPEKNLSPDVFVRCALDVWVAVHGLGHLSVLGVLRHQHSVVRRYNCESVFRAMLTTLMHRFLHGIPADHSPLYEKLRHVMEEYSQTKSFPQSSDALREKARAADSEAEMEEAASELALRLIGSEGLEAVTVERLAEELDVSLETVLQAVDNEYSLQENLEDLTDREIAEYLDFCMRQLPEGASECDRLRAMGVAYFEYAMNDPLRFNAMISLGSKSVVPSSAVQNEQFMGEAYKLFLQHSHAALLELGFEPSDQDVYIRTLTLWAGTNGLCHLAGLSDLRALTLDEKWGLMGDAMDFILETFALGQQDV